MALTCDDIKLQTEGSLIGELSGYCSISASTYTQSAIGEKKTAVYEITNEDNITDGFKVWFVPSLFELVCDFASKYASNIIDSPPPVAFFIEVVGSPSGVPMSLIGAGAATSSQKNFEARFTLVSATEFKIEFDFYMVEDFEDWLTGTTRNNNDRLLKNSKFAYSQLTNTTPAVYNEDRKLCSLTYVKDPNTLVPNPNGGADIPKEAFLEGAIPITSRFYNKGLYNGVSEFTNPVFSLKRAGTPVADFSSVQDTFVEFFIDSAGCTINHAIAWLIDVDASNNSLTFVDNYDSSRAEILTVPGAGTIANHLKSPSVQIALDSGSTYKTSFYVGNSVDVNSTYRLIMVCYCGSEVVNSFISEEIGVKTTPDAFCCPLNYTPYFKDYQRQFDTRCFSPTMQERISVCLEVNAGVGDSNSEFLSCLSDYTDVSGFIKNWAVDYLKAVRLKVYRKVVGYPTASKTTFFYFGQYESIYTSGYPGNFNNISAGLTVSENSGEVTACFDTRVRYEENLLPIAVFTANNTNPYIRTSAGASSTIYSTVNGVTFDWAEQDIIFEWEIELDLTPIFSAPFIVSQFYEQYLYPRDYEGETYDCLSSVEFYAPDTKDERIPGEQISGVFCASDYTHIFMKTTTECLHAQMQIGFFDESVYNSATLEEDDPLASNTGFTQLNSQVLFSDEEFETGEAWIQINLTGIEPGKYRICSLSKPYICTEGMATEDELCLLLENGNNLIIE